MARLDAVSTMEEILELIKDRVEAILTPLVDEDEDPIPMAETLNILPHTNAQRVFELLPSNNAPSVIVAYQRVKIDNRPRMEHAISILYIVCDADWTNGQKTVRESIWALVTGLDEWVSGKITSYVETVEPLDMSAAEIGDNAACYQIDLRVEDL
jgi:hypothetical protein